MHLRIKDVYYSYLTNKAQEIIDFYSDAEKAIPFVHQLEHDLKPDDSV